METCLLCGKEAKNKSGLAAHMRMKHQPRGDDTVAVVPAKELANYHLPSGPNKKASIRTVKMVAPICPVCTDGVHPRDWFNTCTHDPFFHDQEMPEIVENRDYQDDGSYIVSDRKTVFRVRRMPNLRQVPLSPRHMGIQGSLSRKKFNRGWVVPEQVGVAPFCQALDCWSQDLPPRWVSEEGHGMYCAAAHALPNFAQEVGVVLEVEGKKRSDQLSKLNFR